MAANVAQKHRGMTSKQAHKARVEWLQGVEKPALYAVADACGTTAEYIRQVAHGYGSRRPSVDMAQRLGKHSGLPREFWRPDVW